MLVVELLRYLTTYSLLNKKVHPLVVLLFAKCVLSTPSNRHHKSRSESTALH